MMIVYFLREESNVVLQVTRDGKDVEDVEVETLKILNTPREYARPVDPSESFGKRFRVLKENVREIGTRLKNSPMFKEEAMGIIEERTRIQTTSPRTTRTAEIRGWKHWESDLLFEAAEQICCKVEGRGLDDIVFTDAKPGEKNIVEQRVERQRKRVYPHHVTDTCEKFGLRLLPPNSPFAIRGGMGVDLIVTLYICLKPKEILVARGFIAPGYDKEDNGSGYVLVDTLVAFHAIEKEYGRDYVAGLSDGYEKKGENAPKSDLDVNFTRKRYLQGFTDGRRLRKVL